jgi:hypothetical protein
MGCLSVLSSHNENHCLDLYCLFPLYVLCPASNHPALYYTYSTKIQAVQDVRFPFHIIVFLNGGHRKAGYGWTG